jgi:hypothetical protein
MSSISSLAGGAAFIGGALFGGGKNVPQSRTFGIDAFAAELGKGGTAKPYLFSVLVLPPPGIIPLRLDALQLRIEKVSMPRRAIATFDNTQFHGPERKIAYGVTYSNISLEIILSENMIEREYFMRWQDAMFANDSPAGGSEFGGHRRGEGSLYDSAYFDAYTGFIEILQYAESPAFQGVQSRQGLIDTIIGTAQSIGFNTSAITSPFGINLGIGKEARRDIKPCYTIRLLEAYPISISDVQLDWSGSDSAKLNVEMQFRTITEKHPGAKDPAAQGGLASLVRNGINTLNAFRPAISLIKNNGLGGALNAGGNASLNSASAGTRGLFSF